MDMLIAAAILVITVVICVPIALRIIKSIDKQAKKNSKKLKSQQGPFTTKVLVSLGALFLASGLVLRMPFVAWVGIFFCVLWAEEYARMHPRFKKPVSALSTILVVLTLVFIAAALIGMIYFWLKY